MAASWIVWLVPRAAICGLIVTLIGAAAGVLDPQPVAKIIPLKTNKSKAPRRLDRLDRRFIRISPELLTIQKIRKRQKA
jgi:hypothetical protein